MKLLEHVNNIDAWHLGEIANIAGDPQRNDVGDYIDRGLILARLLKERGFHLMKEPCP